MRHPQPYWAQRKHWPFAFQITPTICALCDAVDAPIISTSANRRGEVAARSAGAVIEALGDEIAGVTVGMLGGVQTPSHLRTWQGQRLR